MSKTTLFTAFTCAALLLAYVPFGGVDAYVSSDLQITRGSLHTSVEELVEFTATCTGGVPPYTYQWYTQLWPTWKPEMGSNHHPIGSEVTVPGATSNVFKFIPSTNGTFLISLSIADANGTTQRAVWLPGVWVFVSPKTTSTTLMPPNITILNPIQTTYTTNEVTLNFTVTKPTAKTTYSLNRQTNTTINDNATLKMLPNGAHILTVYVTDLDGLGASASTAFNIEAPTQKPTSNAASDTTTSQAPFLVAVAILTLIVVALSVLALKRRKKRLASSQFEFYVGY